MVLDPVSDLLSSKPSKVVQAPAAVTKGVGISVFSLGFPGSNAHFRSDPS